MQPRAAASRSLAHCVAKDRRLGKGIATAFRERFYEMQEQLGDGGNAIANPSCKLSYKFVTKPKSSGSLPTPTSMHIALVHSEKMLWIAGKAKLLEVLFAPPRGRGGGETADGPNLTATVYSL